MAKRDAGYGWWLWPGEVEYGPLPSERPETGAAPSTRPEKLAPMPAAKRTKTPTTLKVKNLVCRVCTVENGIQRAKDWWGIGRCSMCGELHMLYEVVRDE